jgi:hypothetical protein
METRSNTTSESPKLSEAPLRPVEGLVLAVLDNRDFARAQAIITGFDRWLSFDDFVSELDGRYIGLSCAGYEPQFASISLRSFELWMLHSGISSTISALNEFAARIHEFCLYPALPVEGVATMDWSRDADIGARDGRFKIPIAAALYEKWLEAFSGLDIFTETPSIDTYARMLVEFYTDSTA